MDEEVHCRSIKRPHFGNNDFEVYNTPSPFRGGYSTRTKRRQCDQENVQPFYSL
jgi:hypothetical protein